MRFADVVWCAALVVGVPVALYRWTGPSALFGTVTSAIGFGSFFVAIHLVLRDPPRRSGTFADGIGDGLEGLVCFALFCFGGLVGAIAHAIDLERFA